MAFVKVRVPRTSQPQDACGIDWSNPITVGLKHALSAVQGCDLVSGKPLIYVGALSKKPGPYGVGLSGNNSSMGYVMTSAVGNAVTMLAVVNRLTRTSNTNILFGFGSTAGDQLMAVQASTTAPATRFLYRNVSGGSTAERQWAANATATGKTSVLGVVSPNTYSAAINVYWGGDPDNGTAANDANGTNAVYNTFGIGGIRRSTYLYADTGNDVEVALAFDRALSGEEVKSLSDNPWQIFEPEEITIWVPDEVGAGGTDHLVTPANSQQINIASTGAITQTHLIGAAHSTQANTAGGASVWQTHQVGASSSTQANVGTAGSVSQGSITQVTAANSTQPNVATAGSITQAHHVGAASSGTGHTGTAAAVSQTHLISAASSQQANTATAGSVSQSGAQTVSAADSVQANTASAGGISQTHLIVCAPVAVDNVASASSIVQTHLIGAANSAQGNSATAGGVTSSAPGAAVWPLASQVLAGVVYGPTGVEYTGTYASGSGPSAADIAAAVRADLAAELAMLDAAVSSRATVTQIMEYAGP